MGGEGLKVFLLSDKNFHIEMLFCPISLQWLTTGLFSWFCTTFFLYQKMMTKEVRSLWDSEQQNQDSKGFYQVGKECFVLSGTNMNFDNVSCTWVDLGYLIDCKLRMSQQFGRASKKLKWLDSFRDSRREELIVPLTLVNHLEPTWKFWTLHFKRELRGWGCVAYRRTDLGECGLYLQFS